MNRRHFLATLVGAVAAKFIIPELPVTPQRTIAVDVRDLVKRQLIISMQNFRREADSYMLCNSPGTLATLPVYEPSRPIDQTDHIRTTSKLDRDGNDGRSGGIRYLTH